VDNWLGSDIVFPERENVGIDYVKSHGEGFKNLENVDLLKHYLRLYKKNKFRMKKIKDERKQK
jgi:hypothetical protein